MISREKMDKIIPIVQAGIVVVYLAIYIVSDVFRVRRAMRRAKKTIRK